ncbi:MAG: hypothetical protein L6Q66_07350 [Bacteroidia bacterium]|nr:hypothetical protein [Bacteroidia bacterium]
MKLLFAIFIIFSFTSCTNNEKGMSNATDQSIKDNLITSDKVLNSENEISEKRMNDKFEFAGDSVILPEFEIELKLSENAEKKLKSDKESIVVQAYFSGIPKDTTMEDYIEWGNIKIGSARIELFDKRIARFENIKIHKETLELLSDKNFEVLINVFTGRRSSSNNLLDTDIIQEGIDSIKSRRHLLKGKLIYGD